MINHLALDEAEGVLILADNGKDMLIKCTYEEYKVGRYRYQRGELIQDAFPFLNNSEREFLVSGFTLAEQNNLFDEDQEEIVI